MDFRQFSGVITFSDRVLKATQSMLNLLWKCCVLLFFITVFWRDDVPRQSIESHIKHIKPALEVLCAIVLYYSFMA